MRDKDFFKAVNKHDADKYPDNGHLSEGDDEYKATTRATATVPGQQPKKWKEPVERRRNERQADKEEAPPSWIPPTGGRHGSGMQKPPYDG